MKTSVKRDVLDKVTCERDGDVLYVTIPHAVISPVVHSWALGTAMLAGVIAIFAGLTWVGSRVLSTDPAESLLWLKIAITVTIVTGTVAVVASLVHQRKLRKALEVSAFGPERWAVERLALGATDSPLAWLPGMPRVTGAVAVWKSHAWERGVPGVVAVNLPAELRPNAPKIVAARWQAMSYLCYLGWWLFIGALSLALALYTTGSITGTDWVRPGIMAVLMPLIMSGLGVKILASCGIKSRSADIVSRPMLFGRLLVGGTVVDRQETLLLLRCDGRYAHLAAYGDDGKVRRLVPMVTQKELNLLLVQWGQATGPDAELQKSPTV